MVFIPRRPISSVWALMPSNLDGYFTALGEFNRIAQEIGENLAQTARITAQQGWHVLIHEAADLDAFGLRLFGQQVERAFDGGT